MVITKLFGGIGNQMFQYAFGRTLALKNNCALKLNLSFFENSDSRAFSLPHFSTVLDSATPSEIEQIIQKRSSKLNELTRKVLKSRPYVIYEKTLEFDPQNLETQKDVYVDGYWQSEKYFIRSSNQIREDFKIRTAPSAENAAMLRQIKSTTAISLHVRRGDFLDNDLNKIHGTCSIDYYQRAEDLLFKQVTNPIFFIFSDDINWVRENIKLQHDPVVVDINDEKTAYEDLRLMSACRHHVVANSSFSWWGAWLNPHPGKIVIAPKKWFNDPELNRQSQTIVPESWIRL
jgi:hypothetical protein